MAAQDPPPAKLVPLEPEQYEALQRQLGQGAVAVKDLPPQLSALATACPELSTFAVEVVGNVAGEVAGGTKMELPIELLSGVAEIVVENEKDAICKFVIKRLEP